MMPGHRTSCMTVSMRSAWCMCCELVFQAEEQGAIWAAELTDVLLSMKQATQQGREQGKRWLDPLEVLDWEAHFSTCLMKGIKSPHERRPRLGPRGASNSVRTNPLDRLCKHQKAVFCFLEDLRVDFDNNQAERDLRMLKVQQKVLAASAV